MNVTSVLTAPGRSAAIRAMRSLLAFTLALTVAGVELAPQGTKPGSPEDHLPSNITRLTHFGERACVVP